MYTKKAFGFFGAYLFGVFTTQKVFQIERAAADILIWEGSTMQPVRRRARADQQPHVAGPQTQPTTTQTAQQPGVTSEPQTQPATARATQQQGPPGPTAAPPTTHTDNNRSQTSGATPASLAPGQCLDSSQDAKS